MGFILIADQHNNDASHSRTRLRKMRQQLHCELGPIQQPCHTSTHEHLLTWKSKPMSELV
eukprot:9472361-Pyramimonas_sp.AAC.1